MDLLAVTMPFADADQPALRWALAGLAVVIVGIAKSGFGGGVGIIAVPMFIYALGSASGGIGTLLLLLIAADVLSVYHHRGRWDRLNLRRLLPGSLAGIVIGALILAAFTVTDTAGRPQARTDQAERGLKLIVGIIAAAYPLADLVKARYAASWRIRPTWLAGTIAGAAAGIGSTLAHAAGPVTSIYLLGQHLDKQRFVGTSVIYYFTINSIKVIPYLILGLIATDTFVLQAMLLPLIPVGTFTGSRLHRVMSETLFRNIIMALIFLTGLQMITGFDPLKLFQ
jgi:hypothetical protein